jgi:hypothetical protein
MTESASSPFGLDADAPAQKFNQGKPRLAILPMAALVEEALAMEYGCKKYSKHNYLNGEGIPISEYLDAALRHIYAYASGEDLDLESGLNHIGCARANLGMLLHALSLNKTTDDRLGAFISEPDHSADAN